MKTVDLRHIITVCLFLCAKLRDTGTLDWEKSDNTGIFGTSPGQYQTISHGNRKGKVIGYDGENERYENRRNGRGIILEKKKRDRAKEKKD